MAQETKHAKARKVFEQLDIGERISALELAKRVGATVYRERKKVSPFLSREARMGRAKKHIGKDGRMYYERIAPPTKPRTSKPSPGRVAPSKEIRREQISYGEIGERIVNHIDKLRTTISELEKEREEFKRLYHEAEQKVKDLSESQAAAQKTIRLSKLIGDSS